MLRKQRRINVTIGVPISLYCRVIDGGASIESVVIRALRKRYPVSGPIMVENPNATYKKKRRYHKVYMSKIPKKVIAETNLKYRQRDKKIIDGLKRELRRGRD